jgi:hypothetical protein
MTYEESSALMQNVEFRGRIKVACLKYGTYIMDEPSSTPAHSSRIRWAQNTATAPDQAAANLQPMVVMEPSVQAAGVNAEGDSLITDAALQTAVEATVNKML